MELHDYSCEKAEIKTHWLRSYHVLIQCVDRSYLVLILNQVNQDRVNIWIKQRLNRSKFDPTEVIKMSEKRSSWGTIKEEY